MKALKIGSRLGCFFSVAAVLLFTPRGAFGQYISTSGIMDPDGMIEMTVEMAASSGEIDGYVEVDNSYDEEYDYDCWYYLGDWGEFGCFVEYVGAQAYLYDNNSLVAYPVDYSSGDAEAYVSASINPGDTYTLTGYAGADFISDDWGDDDYEMLGELQLDVQASPPSVSQIDPNWGAVDSSGTITVTGQNLVDVFDVSGASIPGAYTSVDSGSSSSQATIDYSIPANDTYTGPQSLQMWNSFGYSNAVTFNVGDATPVIFGISPSTWQAGTTTPNVTFTGQHFGTNLPTLSFSPNPGITYTISSYSDTQIVASITVDSGAPNGDAINVSVTAAGYTGYSFNPAPGQSNNSPQASATIVAPGNPTANISLKFTGAKSAGDQLLFSNATDTCSESLGLQNCPYFWLWDIEGTATVSDDASLWRMTQTLVGARQKGFYRASDGSLVAFDNQQGTQDDTPVPNFSSQQVIDTQNIYWIDSPGLGKLMAEGYPVDSAKYVANFTSKLCSTSVNNDCVSTNWYVEIIINPGNILDTTNSIAALGSISLNF